MQIYANTIKLLFILVYKFNILRWYLYKTFRKTVTVTTKHGKFTLSTRDDFISKDLYVYGQYGLDFILRTLEFLRAQKQIPAKGEGVVLDIGANNGVVSIALIHLNEFSKALAIEPDPFNFQLLNKNVLLNKLEKRMKCLRYAVSDQKGEVQFELSNNNLGDHRVRNSVASGQTSENYNEVMRNVIKVPCEKIDNILSTEEMTSNISLVWIDVQGFEGYVIKGGSKIFSSNIPVVCEIWPYAINRSGMSFESLYELVNTYWKYYWVMRDGKFVCYSTQTFDVFIKELGSTSHEDVVFTK